MSPPLSKKNKRINEKELQELVDATSDLSDIDDEDSDDEIVSHSSADYDNLIEKRLEKLFGISYLKVANNEEVDHEPLVEEHVGESLHNILDSDVSNTPASTAFFVPKPDFLASKLVPLVIARGSIIFPETVFKFACFNCIFT